MDGRNQRTEPTKVLTDNVEEADLVSHGPRVHLAHVVARVFRPDIGYQQRKLAMSKVANSDSVLVAYDVRVHRQQRLLVDVQPGDLRNDRATIIDGIPLSLLS